MKKVFLHALSTAALTLMLTFAISHQAQASGTAAEFEGLQATVFGTPALIAADTKIMIVTHGDSGKADYMVPFAEELAGEGIVAITLARPGCSIDGRKSKGKHDSRKGDLYTRSSMNRVADAVKAIKEQYGTNHIFMTGHSGGAATVALVAALNPDLLEGGIMVCLPADVVKWRHHAARRKGRKYHAWRNSLSPIKYVDDLAPQARFVVIAGADDNNTPMELAEEYVAKATAEGKNIKLIIVPGAGHRLNRDSDPKGQVIMNEATTLLQ
jgi:dienelactone hydrolase